MEFKKFEVEIVRERINEEEKVKMIFLGFDSLEINYSDTGIEDLKRLFDEIFDYIIEKKELIEFVLKDNVKDLYYEVFLDIIDQINQEIKESEENFNKIFELVDY